MIILPTYTHTHTRNAMISHMSPETDRKMDRQWHNSFHCVFLFCMKQQLTVECSSGVWEVLGLLKKPWCGTRYSSASTASSMSSPLIRLRYNLASEGLGRCMRSSPCDGNTIQLVRLVRSIYWYNSSDDLRSEVSSHLNDQITRRIPSHLGKLCYEFSETRSTVRIDHPACADTSTDSFKDEQIDK